MQIIDSVLSFSGTQFGGIAISLLLLFFLFQRVTRRFIHTNELTKQQQAELKRIQALREQYKHDISSFVQSYNHEIYKKLEEENSNKGVFVFWNEADNIFEKFVCDSSEISMLPSKEERVAIRSFYTEAKALVDGILYNNYLLKKYQLLRCRIKTTTATTAEIHEVDNVTEQLSTLGGQLRQQHQELISSLKTARVYF